MPSTRPLCHLCCKTRWHGITKQVIYVARNPKDVSVSLYHHARNKQKDSFVGDQSYMIGRFVQGR